MGNKNSQKFSLKSRVISFLSSDADSGDAPKTVEPTICKTKDDPTCPGYSEGDATCDHECHATNGPRTKCKCMTNDDCNGDTTITNKVFPDKTMECDIPKVSEQDSCQTSLQQECCEILSADCIAISEDGQCKTLLPRTCNDASKDCNISIEVCQLLSLVVCPDQNENDK